MAAVTQARVLGSSLLARGAEPSGDQAWIDQDFGLVVGQYPNPCARYDFAQDKLVVLAQAAKPKVVRSLLGSARRIGEMYELETPGAIYKMGSATQLLIEGLNIIEEMKQGTIEKLANSKKRSKRPVAKTRNELYDYPHPDSHSAELRNGYFAATNNKSVEACGYLREAAQLADLAWGSEIVVRRV